VQSLLVPAVNQHLTNVTVVASNGTKKGCVSLPDGATVSQALRGIGITLGKYDRVQPKAHTLAFDGMVVHLTRIRADLQKTHVTIPPTLLYKPTTVINRGEVQTIQQGKPGIIEITTCVWTRDGKVTSRQVVKRHTVQPVRNQIIALGTRDRYMPQNVPYNSRYAQAYALAARGGSPRDRMGMQKTPADAGTLRPIRSLELVATGYSPDPRENGGSTRTATGLGIGYGAAAVDPRVIPLGTKLYVEGYGYALACDTGGAIKGHRIDLAYDSYYVANTKGRRRVRVWILAP
jgi:3D (Asp-Asp-Asp) domain-containing protein